MTATSPRFLVDTDVVIYYVADLTPATLLVSRLMTRGVAMSAITYMEVLEGIDRGPDPEQALARFHEFAGVAKILKFDQREAIVAVGIRKQLRGQERSIRSRYLDLLVAATGIAHNLTVVTNNPSDYRDIPNLQLLDAQIVV